jgi:tRNA(Arg) A34 adenosine deaminase TadA
MSKRKYTIRATTYDRKGKVIAVAYNNYNKTHPEQARIAAIVGMEECQFLHAEVAVIIRSRARSGHIHRIRIERYDRMGQPKLAEPCVICKFAIQEAGIREIEYTLG